MSRNQPSKREQIIQAASQIVTGQGVNQLTLEAVAAAAGVSKGGLLYHFPNKDALIEGMLEAYLAGFEARVEALTEQYSAPGQWLRAFVAATFEESPAEYDVIAGALAALVNQPDLLDAFRVRYATWKQRSMAEGTDPATVMVVMAAADGIWLGRIFGFQAANEAELPALQTRLFEFIEMAHQTR
jgi:AcrR family transcriptional regulator